MGQRTRDTNESRKSAEDFKPPPAALMTEPVAQRLTLPPPTAAGWESAEDFLPPPPASSRAKRQTELVRPDEPPVTPSRRTTRSSAITPSVPMSSGATVKPPRKKGGMAV